MKANEILGMAIEGKSAGAVIIACIYALLAVLASPDWKLALLIISAVGAGLIFAWWVRHYNHQQDKARKELEQRVNDSVKREEKCNDTVRRQGIALAIIHTTGSKRGRRAIDMFPLELLLGETPAQGHSVLDDARKFMDAHGLAPARTPSRRRKR